ncbi:MAG: phosphoribosylformylglycinamidine synthase [Oscillospiraceae bacterium]|nr:phosphoribosylformylglycinamidine synthase [Oscillospiraceae bacterium]
MIQKVYRCYTEKRQGHDVAANAVQTELEEVLGLDGITLRLFNRYDLQNLPCDRWEDVVSVILSQPMSDLCYDQELPALPDGTRLLCVEPIPGQFDVRADSCEQSVQMLLGGHRPVVRTAKVYALGGVDDRDLCRIKDYLINPLECREASADRPETLLETDSIVPDDIPVIDGFTEMDRDSLCDLSVSLGLAMSMDDLVMIQRYFAEENRLPTLTELRVIDTYWSDHCRHTTFNTVIESAEIQDSRVQKAYDLFLSTNGDRPVTLMNMATAAMRHLGKQGKLPMLDLSEENNACTLRINAEFEHGSEDWLLFFKNETHNHPTEIEPFGGASTCIGGAIRDPLSGRAYVYQGMRISGAGDPRKPYKDTLPGKLPQRKLTRTAAEGFSSYGNQIGLATGYVRELYHDGYIAKRLEAGAVVGAAPASWVYRDTPAAGDVVVILGGRTGRDGIGGATGSSKTHGAGTVSECASEVQKGNAPEERKLQRLFRNPAVTALIKRCNDFGAGGAAVAIGELADGVEIDLDIIPVKYQGLGGTELAISESQERMAAVVAEGDLPALLKHAESENIEAVAAAKITAERRLVMMWRGQKIVDIKREFLDTNGAERYSSVYVPAAPDRESRQEQTADSLLRLAADLGFCSQKGLVERFDSSIGAASVLMPFGGKHALTETQVMAALLPATGAKTASVMAYGFDPHFTESDPFAGSAYAVVTSVAKLIAIGVGLDTIHLSLQEFFPRLNDSPARWGRPFSAMLGAFSAQMGLGTAAIGGKDSMSGSFGDLDVPSTLISFAAGTARAERLLSPEFKNPYNPVYLLETPMTSDGLPDYAALKNLWAKYTALCYSGRVLSAWACETGGVYGGIIKMALGNMIGFIGNPESDSQDRHWGSIIFEAREEIEELEESQGIRLLGYTQTLPTLTFVRHEIPLKTLRSAWEDTLEGVFPTKTADSGEAPMITDNRRAAPYVGTRFARPKAVIPVFPGTNCEYDTAAAIERAGGRYEFVLIKNLTPDMLRDSVAELEDAILSAQMLVFPGGFSGGDEPDGSGKFIVSLFKGGRLTDAVCDLLQNRDGLILGICNGFQALIKLGLLPYGKIMPMTADCPTLTFNRIGRHQSKYVRTRVSSVMSPWLSRCNTGEVYLQPISHGEGCFTASAEALEQLKNQGQIAFQYTDYDGNPSMDTGHNPNGSVWAVEGICSPNGRILGKMAHTERYGEYTAINIPGGKYLPLFAGGVEYYK